MLRKRPAMPGICVGRADRDRQRCPRQMSESEGEARTLVGGESRFAVVNGVRLHYVEAGAGPLVVLLHGFPNCWHLWRRQIPALAAAGCRVVAPDLRGYNLSEKPDGVRAYRVAEVARDVTELIAHCGAESAAVVGHDWGGVIAWRLATRQPAVVRKLAVLNAPPPAAFARELRRPGQLARSSYALFFQLPRVPEVLLRAHDFALLERVLRSDPSRADAFTDDDIERHKRAWREPGALTAMINYYRAAGRGVARRARVRRRLVTCPTLVIWGERDRYLRSRLAEGMRPYASRLRVQRLPDASHWVPADAPDEVNALLAPFVLAR